MRSQTRHSPLAPPFSPILDAFPRVDRTDLARTNNQTPNRPPSSATASASTRILIADDIPVNRKLLRIVLQRLGYASDEVATGREAVLAVQRYPYRLILMDVNMPEMDGIEATRAIRQAQSLEWLHAPTDLHIVACTASCTPEIRRSCFEAGMDAYLTKPLRIPELAEIVARFARPTQSA